MNKTDLNITQSETWLNAKFNFQSIRHRSVIMFKAMFFFSAGAMFFFSAGAMFGYCYKHYDEKVIESNKSK
ncbi:hypothetical protein U1T28_000181 [Acinetobacter baumannii]|nr:hypothetical protein [Acinetobacter baumannii]